MKNLKFKIRNGLSLALMVYCLLLIGTVSSQTVYTRYWVGFTDKNGSPYSISNPSAYLSARSIARRTNQGIAVNMGDIPVNATYIQQVSATGALVKDRSRWFNGVIVEIINQSQIAAIGALSCVQNMRPLARVKASKKIKTTIKDIAPVVRIQATQADTFNYGQSKGQIYLLNGECLHNKGYNGTGMQIGIIDDGFLNSHGASVFDTLWDTHQVLGVHNFYSNDTSVYTIGGHGTEVLSCITAYSSGQMIGTAPKAKFYLLRSEIDSTEKIVEVYQWVSAIEYADSAGADVINSSLGYTLFDDTTQNFTWADLNGRTAVASLSATMAARRGMICCIAAGNEGCGNNTGSSALCWQKISVPADADSILAVGAINSDSTYASFSSTGNTADGRIKPDVVAQGVNTTIANVTGIYTGSGTSFASPTIAGLVTCLWQGNPTKTNMEVINAVKQSASQYAHPDSLLGYGIPNFCVADEILKGTVGIKSVTNNLINALCGSVDCELTVTIYDVAGRVVLGTQIKSSQNNTPDKIIQSLNLSTLSSGMYVVKITSSNGNSYAKKLVKS